MAIPKDLTAPLPVVFGVGYSEPTDNLPVNYVFYEADTQKFKYWNGTAVVEIPTNPNYNDYYWDDLRFAAGGFNPTGSTAPPTEDTSTGLLSFAGNADNIIGGVAQMPHAWKRGSAIRPHLHLIFPTTEAAKNTRWKLEYDIANPNENFVNAYATYTALPVITVANPNNAKKHVLASFAEIDMTGYRESTVVTWRITRLAASDVLDDDTNACILAEFDIHYQIDKTGTATEIPAV